MSLEINLFQNSINIPGRPDRVLDDGGRAADHERVRGDRDVRGVLREEPQEHLGDVLLRTEGRSPPLSAAVELQRKGCKGLFRP